MVSVSGIIPGKEDLPGQIFPNRNGEAQLGLAREWPLYVVKSNGIVRQSAVSKWNCNAWLQNRIVRQWNRYEWHRIVMELLLIVYQITKNNQKTGGKGND